MFSASVSAIFGAVLNALFLVVSVYIYVSLLRQIAARRLTITLDPPPVRTFGLPETVVALGLIAWFMLNVVLGWDNSVRHVSIQDIVQGLLLSIGLLLFLAAFLKLRRLDLNSMAGFSKIGFTRAILTGGVLLVAAYPLIVLGDALAQSILGMSARSSRQPIVDLFTGSETIGQRILIIFVAVVFAPIFEEFVFRFFLYGVLKRYLGPFLGLVFNALLFATVHMHLPSFIALFVLGSCFTIAYEWSGSILLSMTMHSLFNAVMLTMLAFPELFSQ